MTGLGAAQTFSNPANSIGIETAQVRKTLNFTINIYFCLKIKFVRLGAVMARLHRPTKNLLGSIVLMTGSRARIEPNFYFH